MTSDAWPVTFAPPTLSHEELLLELERWAPPREARSGDPPPNLRAAPAPDESSCGSCVHALARAGAALGPKVDCTRHATSVSPTWVCDSFDGG